MSGVLAVREVAKRLRLSTATVYRLCSTGALAHFRVMNSIRVPRGSREELPGAFAAQALKARSRSIPSGHARRPQRTHRTRICAASKNVSLDKPK
jgi:excisionase family DNA binding protein